MTTTADHLPPLQPLPEAPVEAPPAGAALSDGLVLAGLLLFALAGTVLLVFLHRREKRVYLPLDTRDRLDAYDQRPRGPITVLGPTAAYGLPFLFALWHWGSAINDAFARGSHELEALRAWWALQATPEEQTVLLVLGGVALLLMGLFAFVGYYVIFRTLWPDLCRLDPDASPYGRPEVLGRLYARAHFLEDGRRMTRLYYHQNFRVFPPQCDVVDVPADTPTRSGGIGKLVMFFPRLQRAPRRGRWVRELAERPYGSAPLRSTFRDEEVRRDRRRKVGIVLTGASMNPDVTQRKYEREATITQFQHDTLRGLLPAEIAASAAAVRATAAPLASRESPPPSSPPSPPPPSAAPPAAPAPPETTEEAAGTKRAAAAEDESSGKEDAR